MSAHQDIAASKARFFQHASLADDEGNKYLSKEDFLAAVAPHNENYKKIGRQSYEVLFSVADHSNAGRVSLKDWLEFDQTLDRPDAEYQIAFRVFDREGLGSVDFKDFVTKYNQYKSPDSLPFDWDAPWAQLYVGEGGNRHSMSYGQFSQMLRGIVGERIRQAFQFYDKNHSGFITPQQFEYIIRQTAGHKLNDVLLDSLTTIVNRPTSTSRKVSYATVRAFYNLINNVELAQMTASKAANSNGEFTRKDFMNSAADVIKFVTITPLEVDLLFHFAHTPGSPDRASLSSIERLFDSGWEDARTRYLRSTVQMAEAAKNVASDPRSFFSNVFENAYNFTLGSIAGAFGATVVYPIDLVKTRMQNQRKTAPGQQPLYKNSWDCFKKVISREGVRGLYSGLGPQLIGVAPEKAIKLTVNDLVRGRLTGEDGSIEPWAEILAGGSAGACQVVFTNPLEIVKIRLQVQGELARAEGGAPKKSALLIVRQLGLVGLYKGATACLLRDVPFSAIYFPTYAHLKRDYFGEGDGKKLRIWELLTAGAIAGIPAAYLTTPADVIKTRLQVESRPGSKAYKGVFDAAGRIWKEEGLRAFFKGGPARILRSSPQFGTTLAAYEVLKRLFPFPGSDLDNTEAGHKVPTASSHQSPVKYLRSRNSLKVLLDLDENFGKPWTAPDCLPNTSSTTANAN